MAEFHYDDRAVREDLSDFISNLSPTENTLYSGLGKVKAQQPYHQWLNDTLKTVGTNAQVEGLKVVLLKALEFGETLISTLKFKLA